MNIDTVIISIEESESKFHYTYSIYFSNLAFEEKKPYVSVVICTGSYETAAIAAAKHAKLLMTTNNDIS